MASYTKVCAICGKTFNGRSENAKYCSNECRQIVYERKLKGNKSYRVDGSKSKSIDEPLTPEESKRRIAAAVEKYELQRKQRESWLNERQAVPSPCGFGIRRVQLKPKPVDNYQCKIDHYTTTDEFGNTVYVEHRH